MHENICLQAMAGLYCPHASCVLSFSFLLIYSHVHILKEKAKKVMMHYVTYHALHEFKEELTSRSSTSITREQL